MNRINALIYVVKLISHAVWRQIGCAPQLWEQARTPRRPDHCELCGIPIYPMNSCLLARASTHPGRGKWCCFACIYGRDTEYGPQPHENTPQQAMAFRRATAFTKQGGARKTSYKALLAKRSRIARKECRPTSPSDLH